MSCKKDDILSKTSETFKNRISGSLGLEHEAITKSPIDLIRIIVKMSAAAGHV